MRPAVRLTRQDRGGFRLDGVERAPIEASRDGDAFTIGGAAPFRVAWSDAERGWILSVIGESGEAGRTTASERDALAPTSLLLADGRLFRLAAVGASAPVVELGRWDGPGAYVVARPVNGTWELTRTPAGEALEVGPELWILAAAEIGRMDGWW
ncbi:MAG TPA: hypothetical protein VFB67_12530 [Candidatus Polarisedimenticolaceae bacterium]|nr:hypothetical protein [Candidatus Polarisedimenticolaceae bacterium]